MDQHRVGLQVTRLYSSANSVQEAKLCLTGEWQVACTYVGMCLALTGRRAGQVAEVLIVMPWTLAPAVTDVCQMQTDSGTTTAVETRAGGRTTLLLILMMWAVVHTIAADIQGQAVARTCQCYTLQHTSKDEMVLLLLFVGCLTSQQHASVSQGRICSDKCTCCHTEIEVADQTSHLTQSQYTDTGPTSPSADPITPGAWQGSHWSANF